MCFGACSMVRLRGIAPKDVVLMIGTNNTATHQTAEQVTAGITAVTEELHRRLPEAKLMVLRIFLRDQ